jgi:hypothetical protein
VNLSNNNLYLRLGPTQEHVRPTERVEKRVAARLLLVEKCVSL